ncbi:MAG TPA: hypothetical protein VN823_11695 [Stellaceae bacterium]|nr:hypothetical protein [Stellaceae bacterium]
MSKAVSRRVALACATLLLCAGCGHFVDVRGHLASLEKAQPTATLADLPYEKLALPTDQTFWVDEKSPIVDFGQEGKSYVRAFALPVGNYRVQIRSYSLRNGLLDAAMFFPVVALLDADKNRIDTGGPWTQHKGGIFSDEPNEAIFLEDIEWIKPEKPFRYIVLYTTPALIARGGQAALQSPVQLAAASYHYAPIFIPSGPTGPIPLAGSAVGYLSIKLEPTKP